MTASAYPQTSSFTPAQAVITSGNPLNTPGPLGASPGEDRWQYAPGIADAFEVAIPLDAGNYALLLDAKKGPDGAMIELLIDGASIGTQADLWAPSPMRSIVSFPFTLAGAGRHLFQFGVVARPGGAPSSFFRWRSAVIVPSAYSSAL